MAAMPLDGVRILDFTWVVAGPVATRILADHGAQVVKVERKNPPPIGNRKLGLQCDLHRSKLSVALNMQHPRGVELARRLAAMSDIVMDNFSARVMRMWGMDYESLRAVKPDIICISMSGLGHTGPRSSYVSYGPTLQALTGYTQLMAEPDGTPAGYGYSYADMCGGYTGALAALIALWHRRRTGRGPVRRSVAVRGGRERDRSRAARHLGQRPHAVAARLQFAGRAGRAARRLQMPRARRRRRSMGRDQRRAQAPNGGDSSSRSVLRSGRARRNSARSICGCKTAPSSTPTSRDGPRSTAPKMRWRSLQRAGIAAGVVENGVDLCARDPQLKERGFWPAGLDQEGRDDSRHRHPVQAFRRVGRSSHDRARSRRGFRLRPRRAARPRQSRARRAGRGRRRLALSFSTPRNSRFGTRRQLTTAMAQRCLGYCDLSGG